MLYAELEIAKWLLHGTETRNTAIVDDAVDMLHGLLDSVQNDKSAAWYNGTRAIARARATS